MIFTENEDLQGDSEDEDKPLHINLTYAQDISQDKTTKYSVSINVPYI